MVGYREPTITVTSVEAALKSLKYSSQDGAAAHSLHTLTLVDAFLDDPSVPASPLMREYALRQILTDLITQHYQARGGAPFATRQGVSDSEVYARIQQDGQTDNPDHIGWSMLYHLYIVTSPNLTQELYAQHASSEVRTIYRYKKSALEQLTYALIQDEWHMRRVRQRQRLLMILPPSDGIPLIGREAELAQIDTVFERTPYPCIIVGGVPGCGKSALVREVARRLIEQERVTFLIWLNGLVTPADVDAQIQEQLRAARLKNQWDELTASYPVLVVLENSHSLVASPEAWDEILSVRLGRSITLVAGQELRLTQRSCLHLVLPDLDRAAVTELVRMLLHTASRDTTSHQSYADMIWQAVGGNPAAIRLVVGMLEQGDVRYFQNNALDRLFDQLDTQLSEETQCLWNVLSLFPEGVTQPHLQMLAHTTAIAALIRHGLLTSEGGHYTLSHSARQYRAQYSEQALEWLWMQIQADSETQWGWAAAQMMGHRPESAPTADVSSLLSRYQHEMTLFPHRWQLALGRWVSLLDGSLTLTYAACLLKLGEVKESQRLVQGVIRQAGKQGDFMLQAEALLAHSALGRHQGDYKKALQDLQQVKQMRYLSETLQERLIEEELHIALDREDRVQLQALLPRLTGTSSTSNLLRLEASALLGHWDDCQRLAEQLQRESPDEEAWVLTILGRSAQESQQFAQAADYFQAALLRFEQQQDILSLSRGQVNLASSLLALDHREEAKTLLDTAAPSLNAIRDRVGLSAVQANLDYLSRLNRFKPL